MKLKVKALHPDAIVPQYATVGAACFDLHALMEKSWEEGEDSYAQVNPGTPTVIRTGLAFEIPDGYVMLIFSRSGHGFKNDIRLANCVGVIDSDYRGELRVALYNESDTDYVIHDGDRIAQLMVLPVVQPTLEFVDELDETERGAGGFGSTGR